MFEAIHGSAPRRAGQNLANPSGLLLGGVMMLVHIDQTDVAENVHNAWLKTLEDGVHTYDIFQDGVSKEKVGTREFAAAVVARLGQKPTKLKAAAYQSTPKQTVAARKETTRKPAKKDLVGVDVFLHWTAGTPDQLGETLKDIAADGVQIEMISNRGMKVWPQGHPETFCSDHWRCRFMAKGSDTISHKQISGLLSRLADAGLDFIKTENLCNFDGQRGYSLDQGA
jgi:isocitrate dehydrogenase